MGAGEVTEDLGELLGRPVAFRHVRLPLLARALWALVAVRPQNVPDGFPHIQFEMIIISNMNLDSLILRSKPFKITQICTWNPQTNPQKSYQMKIDQASKLL